jgi:hypothetical protein
MEEHRGAHRIAGLAPCSARHGCAGASRV